MITLLWVSGFIVTVLLLAWCNYRLETARERRERHGVRVSKATGGAYADMEEVIESELERIRGKKP